MTEKPWPSGPIALSEVRVTRLLVVKTEDPELVPDVVIVNEHKFLPETLDRNT